MKSALSKIKSAQSLDAAAECILSNLDEYDVGELIFPDGEKEFYYECGYIISKLPCEVITTYAVELMAWFQDLNWPGVEQIYGVLCSLPVDTLSAALQIAYKKAVETADEEWIYNLNERFSTAFLLN